MSTLSGFIDCPAVQTRLINLFNHDNLIYTNWPTLTEFLLSDRNTTGFMSNTIARNGHLFTIEAIYTQRYTPDEIGEGCMTCDAGPIQGETSKLYTLEACEASNVRWSIRPDDLRRRCEADEDYIARELYKAMNGIISRAEQVNAQKLVLATGNFASDVDNGDPAGTSTYKNGEGYTADGNIRQGFIEAVSFENMNNGFGEMPIVFGGETIFKYSRSVNAACCNLQTGIDTAVYKQQNDYAFGFNRDIASALGVPNGAIAVIPGAVQLLHANRYDNPIWQVNNGVLTQGTVSYPDARLPIRFDYRVQMDCDSLNFELNWNYDLAFMPDDMYKSNDRLFGVNGVTEFRLTTGA